MEAYRRDLSLILAEKGNSSGFTYVSEEEKRLELHIDYLMKTGPAQGLNEQAMGYIRDAFQLPPSSKEFTSKGVKSKKRKSKKKKAKLLGKQGQVAVDLPVVREDPMNDLDEDESEEKKAIRLVD